MRISDWSSDVCSSDLAWPVAYRVGRGAEQQGLDEAALPHHRAGVALVVVGVAAGEAGELAAQRVVVRVVGEVAAIAGEGGAALVGDDLTPVARQVEVAHYLRPPRGCGRACGGERGG